MQRVILSILYLILIYPKFSYAEKDHLQELNSKFPYALIGDDFGILNEDDLAINACEATPSPFSLKEFYYPRWQCFEAKTVHVICNGHGFDESEKIFYTLLAFTGTKNKENHEYLTRRTIPYEACISYAQSLHHLLRDEKYICFSGPFMEKKVIGFKGKNLYSWIFNSFKTKKGCDSYFKGWCDLKFLKNQGHSCDSNRK